jgi:polyisoprenyl-phosphate glycosyltransferase
LYEEESRIVGESKYTFFRQLVLAVSGIISFSEKPLYLALYAGIFSVCLSFIYASVIISKILLGSNFEVDGWVSLIIAIIFFGGMQLLTIGILGIYVGKVFIESKKRPRYIIDKSVGFESLT